jgi:chromosome segregation ATPase
MQVRADALDENRRLRMQLDRQTERVAQLEQRIEMLGNTATAMAHELEQAHDRADAAERRVDELRQRLDAMRHYRALADGAAS